MKAASFAVALVVATAAHAGAIGYAAATGYFKKDTRPTLYQPLNLLDGREITAWCSPTSDPLNDQLTFGFKGPTKIDEIRVYTGNGFDESTWQEFSRAKKLAIKGPAAAQKFTVADQRGLQSVPLNPPINGQMITLEILDQYPADDPDQPVCLTDVVFFSEGKPLNGSWLTTKLKYDKAKAPLLGTWFAGYEGAADKFLSFYFDGTFRYVYDPYDKDKDKPKEIGGDFEVSGNRLTLDMGGKKVSAKFHKDKNEKSGKGHALVLEGDLPEELKPPFRDQL